MKNLFYCFIALSTFLFLFSISIFILKLFSIELNGLSELIGLFGANATLFGTLVIIYGFSQWKEQANIQLSRDLALKCSDALANERDSITQIYALFKVNYISFRQFSPEIFEEITADASTIFENAWESYVDASCLTHRNCSRLERINNDNDLKGFLSKYSSLCHFLTGKFEHIYNYKMQAHSVPPTSNIGFDIYTNAFVIIEEKFSEFKKLSNEIDEHLDQYIVIKK